MPYKNTQLKMVCCPFNPQHRFTQDRLQMHIIKCSRNYKNVYRCIYNALHCFLSKEDCNLHILSCNDKLLKEPWEQAKPHVNGCLGKTLTKFDLPCIPTAPNDEDWSADYE